MISSRSAALGHDVAAEDVADLLDQLLAEDLPARDVDARRTAAAPRAAARAASAAASRAARSSTCEPSLHDEIGLLGDGHEIGRVDQAALRMLPAHHRLEAGELLGRQVDDRLVEDAELVLRRAPCAGRSRSRRARRGRRASPAVKISMRSAPPRLARYMAISASLQQSLVGSSRRRRRRRCRREPVSTISWPAILIGERSERRTRSASEASSCGVLIGSEQDRELVAADARQRVLRRQMALQAARHRSSRLSPTTSPNDALTLLNLSMSMKITSAGRRRSVLARIAATSRRSSNSSRLGRPGQAVVHGIVQQALVRALGVRDVAHEADAAHAPGHRRCGTLAASISNQR